MTPTVETQNRVFRALANVGPDYLVREGHIAPSRRYVIGIPGYLAAQTPQVVVQALELQNPDLPRGSLTPVSVFQGVGERPRPVVFVDASEEAVEYLTSVSMTLRTFSGTITARPLANRPSQ